MTKFAYFEGEFVPIGQAKISIMTHAFNYGTGCFEGIRAYWNVEDEELYVLKMREHYERFVRSCRILMMDIGLDVEELGQITTELLRREDYREDVYIRPIAYKAQEGIGVRLHDLRDAFALFSVPFGRYIEKEEGARVGVVSWRRIDDNMIPARAKITGAYVNSAFAKSEALLAGFDEAIVLNADGHISEGSAENLFLVKNGHLVTPPVSANILEGVTRQAVIELARQDLGIETYERQVDRTELYTADEAFFCGTGVQVVAIVEADHRPVGGGRMGPVVTSLRQRYFRAARGQDPERRAWCTPVYRV